MPNSTEPMNELGQLAFQYTSDMAFWPLAIMVFIITVAIVFFVTYKTLDFFFGS